MVSANATVRGNWQRTIALAEDSSRMTGEKRVDWQFPDPILAEFFSPASTCNLQCNLCRGFLSGNEQCAERTRDVASSSYGRYKKQNRSGEYEAESCCWSARLKVVPPFEQRGCVRESCALVAGLLSTGFYSACLHVHSISKKERNRGRSCESAATRKFFCGLARVNEGERARASCEPPKYKWPG